MGLMTSESEGLVFRAGVADPAGLDDIGTGSEIGDSYDHAFLPAPRAVSLEAEWEDGYTEGLYVATIGTRGLEHDYLLALGECTRLSDMVERLVAQLHWEQSRNEME
jgi:hypothetical protein